MNILKIALLGTAAVAAVSVSARADNLSDLKAQIETLNARVATLEAAPAVPAGYSMVAFTQDAAPVIPGMTPLRNASPTAHYITIMPTADAPAAATTVVSWSGYTRAALAYRNWSVAAGATNDTGVDIRAKAGLSVSGKTDTAVGEIGVNIALQADSGFGGVHAWNNAQSAVMTDGVWGYWNLTPEMTLGAGFGGSLSGNGKGYDGACTCFYTDGADAGYGNSDAAQMRLSYASGPMSFAVAIEDGGNHAAGALWHDTSGFGVAAEVKYAGDMISAEVNAGWLSRVGLGAGQTDIARDPWTVNAGLGFNLGDSAKVSMSAGVGDLGVAVGDDWWEANILGRVNLSDAAHAEIAFNHVDYGNNVKDENAVLAGVYYDPVKQLTIGLEGEWINHPVARAGQATDANWDTQTRLDLVTVFRF
jgi:hypothetical protein